MISNDDEMKKDDQTKIPYLRCFTFGMRFICWITMFRFIRTLCFSLKAKSNSLVSCVHKHFIFACAFDLSRLLDFFNSLLLFGEPFLSMHVLFLDDYVGTSRSVRH